MDLKNGSIVLVYNVFVTNIVIFVADPYRKNITEAVEVGVEIITVDADDTDETRPYNQVKYYIIGDDSAPTYFGIDEDTGKVTVDRDIKNDQTTDYQVLCLYRGSKFVVLYIFKDMTSDDGSHSCNFLQIHNVQP